MPISPATAAAVVIALIGLGAVVTLRARPRGVRWLRFALAAMLAGAVDRFLLEPVLDISAPPTPASLAVSCAMIVGFVAVSFELRWARSAVVGGALAGAALWAVLLTVTEENSALTLAAAWLGATVVVGVTFGALARRTPGSLLNARLRTISLSMALMAVGIVGVVRVPALELIAVGTVAVGTVILWLAVAPPKILSLVMSPTRELSRAVDRDLARIGSTPRSMRDLLAHIGDLFGAEAALLTDAGRTIADVGPAVDVVAAERALADITDATRRTGAGRWQLLVADDRWVLAGPTGRGWLAVVLDEVGLLLGDDDRARVVGLAERIGLALDRVDAAERDRRAADSLRAVDRMRDDFLATLSHELRTPLTSIRGFTEVLREHGDRLPLEQRRDLQARVVEKASQLEEMISGLLELTAVRGRTAPDRVATYDLLDLVDRAVARARDGLREHTVLVDVPRASLHTDGGALLAVLGQLLDNAAKFTPGGSTVVIRGDVRDGCVELLVSDDGPGLGELAEERVFEAFVRGGDVLTRETRGVGIGLAIAKELAMQLGGDLGVRPSEVGTSLRLTVASIRPAVTERRSALDAERADPDLHPMRDGTRAGFGLPSHAKLNPHAALPAGPDRAGLR